jgi:hypothetical protein
MFPVRYVLGGLLFLKPLGTSFNMLPIPIFVNSFCEQLAWISSAKIYPDIRGLREAVGGYPVYKTVT